MRMPKVLGLGEGGFLVLDASAISRKAADLRRGTGRLADDGAQVSSGWRSLTAVYESPVAPGLVSAMEPVGHVASGMSGAMRSAAVALEDYAQEIGSLQTRHRSIDADAEILSQEAAASPNWQSDPFLLARQTRLEHSVSTLESDYDDAREQCVAVLDGILVPAVQITGTFSGAGVGAWDPRNLRSVSSLDAMTPAQVNAWWISLSPAAQSMYLMTEARLIGGLDGIPSAVRDMANRSRLDGELARLVAELETLRLDEQSDSQRERIESLEKRIGAIRSITHVLERGGRLLLHFDITGPEPLAAVAVGDPDHAEFVGVLVGGKGTNVYGGLAKFDSSAEALRENVEVVGTLTEGESAVVAWLGYAAPSSYADAADPSFAQDGLFALRSFTQGLDAARPDGSVEPIITVGGHSYGALPVTLASQLPGSQIDNVVTYGGPGIAKTLPDDINRYWMANGDDPIRGVVNSGWYKYQPSTGDGWEELTTDAFEVDGVELTAGKHHSYLVEGSSTLHNLAAVIAGRPDKAEPFG